MGKTTMKCRSRRQGGRRNAGRGAHAAHIARVALVLGLVGGVGGAQAFEFKSESGELSGALDTTVSLGAMWRAQDRDPALVAIASGGTSRSPNEDDGNRNYDRGDLISALAKVTHDLDVKYGNYGAFARLLYFYDYAIHNKDGLPAEARERLGDDVELLDAYVRGKFDLGGRNLNLRLGNQVVSWGESTFIPNGINVVNPVDVARLRSPGAELKEALLPTKMLWGMQEVNDNLAVEGFYQFEFKKTKLEPRGSFFSSNDYLSPGGDKVFLGFGRRPDQSGALALQQWAPRAADRDAKDSGQYGLVARLLVPEWNNTEIGLYHLNYHSRTPFASSIRGTASTAAGIGSGRSFAEFPENIRLYGLGFSTAGPFGIALQGEYSHRPNQPVQLASIELVLATLGLPNRAGFAAGLPVGTVLQGYKRVPMDQVQFTGTKSFGPQLGAEQLVVVGEVGYTHLRLPSDVLFNGPGIGIPAPGSFTAASLGSAQPGGAGYATRNSWGYRLVARSDYANAVGAVTLSPRLAFAHDVRGVSPTFNQGVKALTVGLGANYRQNWQADLSWTSYFGGRTYAGTDPAANPFGQSRSYATSANPLKDRDFFAATVSYSF